MRKKRVIILGAGISGLSLAWYLSRRDPHLHILILEKERRAGGWLNTQREGNYLCETGPRTFKVSHSKVLLELAHELGLQEQIIFAHPHAKNRYLYYNQRLYAFPKNPFSFLFSPLTRSLLYPLLKEWSVPKSKEDDETVWDFVARRLGVKAAERLFDPLALGIYGGDIRVLSVRSCFKILKEWEVSYGSLTLGLFASLRKRQEERFEAPSPLFSFQGGVETLIDALRKKLSAKILYHEEVQEICFSAKEVSIRTQGNVFEADHVFSALPCHVLAALFSSIDKEVSSLLQSIPSKSLAVVNLAFSKDVLPYRGFGYLIPSSQKEEVLGTVFDSCIFPQQNRSSAETRLTMMFKEGDFDYREKAFQALSKHLSIKKKPDYLSVSYAYLALPQYLLGHEKRLLQLKQKIKQCFPQMHLIGNYLSGASVNECVILAKEAAAVSCARRA